MKKITFLILTYMFCSCALIAQRRLTDSGYSMDFGTQNNTDNPGSWFSYNLGPPDTFFHVFETEDALVFQGRNITLPGASYQYVGFNQVGQWAHSIDLSNPDSMLLKVRLRSTGTFHPVVTIKLVDSLGTNTLCNGCYMITNPREEYRDYYFSFVNKWYDPYQYNRLVDSTRVFGIDFFVQTDYLTQMSDVRLEIDYIQIGSHVIWPRKVVRGKLFYDNNNDCSFNATDKPIINGLVKGMPGDWFTYTDSLGNYSMLVDSSQTSLTLTHVRSIIQEQLLQQVCPAADNHVLSMPELRQEYCCYDFAEKAILTPALHVDIMSNRRRRCFLNSTTVRYSNQGNAAATGTEIKVEYPEYVIPISSNPVWSRKEGQTLFYDLGTLNANGAGAIHIVDSVVCGNEAIRSLTQCTKATIISSSVNIPEDPSWDNSSVTVEGHCDDGIAKFTIANAGTGNMSDSLQYSVFLDDTLISRKKFKLKASRFFTLELPAGLQTVRLNAAQSAYHPGQSMPVVVLEGCVTDSADLSLASRGFINSVPPDDLDEDVSISCLQIIDSYDPNDKQVTPEGKTASHFVLAGTKLDYTIRFENTGSDTAYTVVVQDTLDAGLDVSTLRAGAASHKYIMEMESVNGKNICKFRFNRINLTAKSVDSIQSQGFIKFSVNILPGLTNGTVLENKAGIYFDYNSAIITNTVSHTIGDYQETDMARAALITVGNVIAALEPGVHAALDAKLYPNPFKGELFIGLPDDIQDAEISLYSNTGMLILKRKISGTEKLNTQMLQEGMYYYRITGADGSVKSGKIIRQ